MTLSFTRSLLAIAVAATIAPGAALATNGYFAHGYGTKNKGMAGAGVALPQDAMAAATNPAGMVWVGDRMDIGAALFSPRREYTSSASGSGATLQNAFGGANAAESDSDYFLVPHLARNWMLGDGSSFGVAIYGNGGMNTDYPAPGPFGGGGTGVNLAQVFIAPTYSRKIGDKSSWGVSPIVAIQAFEARGLSNFTGSSSDSANLTNNQHEYSYGAGIRLGWQGEVSPGLTLAAAATSKIYMTEFDDYAGLFAEEGDFDIPPQITVGLAYKIMPRSALTFDIQHIMYGSVDSISNPIGNLFTGASGALGGSNGAGFGWEDMTIAKLGYQWQTSSDWTWRAGVSYGEQPIPDDQVMFNILAPGVMETHLTGGFTRQMGKNNELTMSFMYAPTKEVSGTAPAALGGMPITIEMSQFEVEASWGWTF